MPQDSRAAQQEQGSGDDNDGQLLLQDGHLPLLPFPHRTGTGLPAGESGSYSSQLSRECVIRQPPQSGCQVRIGHAIFIKLRKFLFNLSC